MEFFQIGLAVIIAIYLVLYYRKVSELKKVEAQRDYYMTMRSKIQNELEEMPGSLTISEARPLLFAQMHTYESKEENQG